MQLRKATRQKARLRVGLAGPSGSGKTYSAILMAKGLAGGDLTKVALIDTENGSGELYTHLGEYNVVTLTAPFTPERYIEAIKACEAAGMSVIIIDSISHEWDGKGGCLEIVDQLAQGKMNSYTAWGKVTPRHNAFTGAILQSPCHVITTVRKKQDYAMEKDANGKTTIQKLGLKEITREGFEYELTLNFELSINHLATAGKDRTGLYMDQPEFKIDEVVGQVLLEWANEGVESAAHIAEKLKPLIKAAQKLETLTELKDQVLAITDLEIRKNIIDLMKIKAQEITVMDAFGDDIVPPEGVESAAGIQTPIPPQASGTAGGSQTVPAPVSDAVIYPNGGNGGVSPEDLKSGKTQTLLAPPAQKNWQKNPPQNIINSKKQDETTK